ncbi:hypothetical protein JTE90_024718 [Oedothorax gibbosus]|uniref:Uncharacterized protein n=1 Tax=Oedothorax gibbosus TaxID=931172 RepID=A0AAV6UB70_9ARAC|nr:hypothetical protein JTE90_024718 [Oedothorax gibbosus]
MYSSSDSDSDDSVSLSETDEEKENVLKSIDEKNNMEIPSASAIRSGAFVLVELISGIGFWCDVKLNGSIHLIMTQVLITNKGFSNGGFQKQDMVYSASMVSKATLKRRQGPSLSPPSNRPGEH